MGRNNSFSHHFTSAHSFLIIDSQSNSRNTTIFGIKLKRPGTTLSNNCSFQLGRRRYLSRSKAAFLPWDPKHQRHLPPWDAGLKVLPGDR
jgi:hypothetical protein